MVECIISRPLTKLLCEIRPSHRWTEASTFTNIHAAAIKGSKMAGNDSNSGSRGSSPAGVTKGASPSGITNGTSPSGVGSGQGSASPATPTVGSSPPPRK